MLAKLTICWFTWTCWFPPVNCDTKPYLCQPQELVYDEPRRPKEVMR